MFLFGHLDCDLQFSDGVFHKLGLAVASSCQGWSWRPFVLAGDSCRHVTHRAQKGPMPLQIPMLFFLDIRLQSHRPLSFCEPHDSSITCFFCSSGGLELDRFRCRIACHRVTFRSCQLGVGSRQYVIAVLEDAPTWSGCCIVVTFAVPRSPALMNEGTYPLFSVRSVHSRRGPACEVTTPAPHEWKTRHG